MQKIFFLLPPSEWKKSWGDFDEESVSFSFVKPYNIWSQATEKDLKCKWVRYLEAIELNNNIEDGPFHRAIDRYSWVMYDGIDHSNMTQSGKEFFQENFLIFSGMYGIVRPHDVIWNYKLPIEATWLRHFWQTKITDIFHQVKPDYIINLLQISYQKMIDFSQLTSNLVHINFLTKKADQIVKMTHGVKKIKWEWIKSICEKGIENYNDFWWEVEKKWDEIHVNILYS